MIISRPYIAALLLTGVSGFVDAVGFMSLAHIYTANMSGNSVAVGIALAGTNWVEAGRRVWPVAAYVLGLVVCRTFVVAAAQRGVRRMASYALVIEIVLLIPVCLFGNVSVGGWKRWLGVALLAFAMGVQNATLTHFGSITMHTGFVTGTLVSCAEYVARYITWLTDQLRNGVTAAVIARSYRQTSLLRALWLAIVWMIYVLGALFGACQEARLGFRSLAIAAGALAGVVLMDQREPLAVCEEPQQSIVGTETRRRQSDAS